VRASEVRPGDTLPDGRYVISVSRTDRSLYIMVRDDAGGKPKRLRYQPHTIMPTADERHPSQFKEGHPWVRYRSASRYRVRSSEDV
jgi:hypothetical protein